MQPQFPVLAFYQNMGLGLVQQKTLDRINLHYFLKYRRKPPFGPETLFFDSKGDKWIVDRMSSTYQPTLLDWISSYFIFKLVTVQCDWKKIGTYDVQELKNKILHYIEEDDDIITQYTEADILKPKITNSQNIADVFRVLKRHVFFPENKYSKKKT